MADNEIYVLNFCLEKSIVNKILDANLTEQNALEYKYNEGYNRMSRSEHKEEFLDVITVSRIKDLMDANLTK